ncbi:MAG: hypothetical protein V1811_00035 [Candidatus Micrarchaeota archaeon]
MVRKPFGGMTVSFKGCDDSIQAVFGTGAMPPSEMTKKLWAYVKRKGLMKK